MWSLGAIAAELFLGIPVFPGANEYNQMFKISDMLGLPPADMIARGTRSHKFFKPDPLNPSQYIMKSESEYERDNGVRLDPDKRYFVYRSLQEIVEKYPLKTGYPQTDDSPASQLKEIRRSFLHFLRGVLQIDPTKRWTADQARQHPFITETVLPEGYQPPPPRRRTPAIAGNKPKDTSAMRAQGDICGFYHRFSTALRAGQVIDVASGAVLASLAQPLNPAPSLKLEKPPAADDVRRFRSKSDAVSHPPEQRVLGPPKPHLKATGPEPMAGVVAAGAPAPPATAQAAAAATTTKPIAPSSQASAPALSTGPVPMIGVTTTAGGAVAIPNPPPPPVAGLGAGLIAGSLPTGTLGATTGAQSYRTSAAMPIAPSQAQASLSGSAYQTRLSTSAATTSASLSVGRQTSTRRSSVSEATKKEKKTRRSSGKRAGANGDEPMSMSPSGPNWNPFDLDSSFQDEGNPASGSAAATTTAVAVMAQQ
jgi:hypothetical protein